MRKKEIGSEFWSVPTCDKPNRLFPEAAQWFISGRSALKAVIQDMRAVRTVAMPSWCCESMFKPFLDEGIKVFFYPVYWENGLRQEVRLDCDALFILDYFGYTTEPGNLNYKGIIIRDVTHSIFSSCYSDADYYFGSLRKWCGIWTGGYAWTRDGHSLPMDHPDDTGYVDLRKKAMIQKALYISGNQVIQGNSVPDKAFLQLFNKAEEYLDLIGIAPASERDILLAEVLDADYIKARRRANAEILRTAFLDWLVFKEMADEDCPAFVPVLVPAGKRDALRQYLISKEIYCPVHWPVSSGHMLNGRQTDLYNNELSLVCDQRYSEEDMQRLVMETELFWKEA